MKWAVLILMLVTIILAAQNQPNPQPTPIELNSLLMQATFRIEGHLPNGAPSLGTGFLLGRPMRNDPNRGRYVLVTAAHVFGEMSGDSVNVVMRKKSPQSGWQETRVSVPIRTGGHPLWVQHPRADVAALYVSLPSELVPVLISTDLLATDSVLKQYEIHPGDELNCLGYPLGFQHTGAFPISRSGKIASYPLVPTADNPYFLLDFRVFKGNSGGPVYFVGVNHIYAGGAHLGNVIQFLIGLVSEEVSATEQFQGLYENRSETYPLSIAKIVPAPYILETLKLLPPPE